MRNEHDLRPHFLILIINIATTGWLFAKTQTIDVAANHNVLSEVNELNILSLDLHRLVFELNVDWLNNYDPIIDNQKRRNHVIEQFYDLSATIDDDKKIVLLLDRLSSMIEEKDEILEEIKQVHSQKNNSDIFFPLLVKDLTNYIDTFGGDFRERYALQRLSDLVAIYSESLSEQAKRDIESQIETVEALYSRRLANDPELDALLGSTIEYVRIVVGQAGRLEALSQQFLTLNSSDAIAELYGIFSGYFAREQHDSQSLFPMLYGVLAFMIIHITFLFAQLLNVNRHAMARADELTVSLQREKELSGLQRQFVSMVSHEFRTPLAIIDGSAQRLQRSARNADPERLKTISEKIRLSVGRLVDLMESVLNVARLEEGRIQFDEAEMDLRGMVTEVVDNYRDLHTDRAISLHVDGLPMTYFGDAKLLRQVISNLLSNAIKYSESGSPVDVETAIGHETIAISVRDHGVGIPADEVEKISERFFRASSSTGIAGTGIGLHLVQYILTLHGGRLEVQSVLGEGSCFAAHLAVRHLSREELADTGSDDVVPLLAKAS